MNSQPVTKWLKDSQNGNEKPGTGKRVLLFVDEFTNYNDFSVGEAVVRVLRKLGYEIEMTDTLESGRSFMSIGMLDEARVIANKNINVVSLQHEEGIPIIGIEPSALLSFRDEYLDLADDKEKARKLGQHAYLFEEFIAKEARAGNIDQALFKPIGKTLKYHGHCHQKALSEMSDIQTTLELIPESTPEKIPSGCCGMAGSFGYEKEHYEMSMQVGELVLFPAVREAKETELIVAPGTSCRHQIKDGTSTRAYHPAEVLWMAMS
jgi:Fe-S oxidoreductase